MKGKYTIIFIPPDHSTTRQFQITRRGKQYLSAFTLLIGVVVVGLFARNLYLSHYINHLQPTIDHITQLKSTIKERDQTINNLSEQSTQITEDLRRITDLEEKLSSILQLDSSSQTTSLSRGISSETLVLANVTPSIGTPTQYAQIVTDHLNTLQRYYEIAVVKKDKSDHTPSILPIEGEITSPHGYRSNPFGGLSKEFHNGIDIACNYGAPIKATADGIVTFSARNSIFGLRIDIDHGHGIRTFYGHNSKLLVKEGDKVKKGDIIAYSGNSGRSTGSHLHYGTYVNGKNVDPLTFTELLKET